MLAPEDLISEPEAAAKLGRSRLWLQRRRLDGTGPTHVLLGNRIMYDPADLSAWLESLKQHPTKTTEA